MSEGPLCPVPQSLSARHLAHCLAGNESSTDIRAVCSRAQGKLSSPCNLQIASGPTPWMEGPFPSLTEYLEKQAVPLVFSKRRLIGIWLLVIYF